MNDSAIGGAVVNGESTFLHQFFNIPVAKGVCQMPTNPLQDPVLLKMSSLEGYGCHDGLPLK